MPVRNSVVALMADKQKKEDRVITAAEVARETGLTRQAIHRWIKGDVKEFPGDTIEALCKYFQCGINDLLYIDSDN